MVFGEYGGFQGAEGHVPTDIFLDMVLNRMDFFFMGGFQIDKYGNANMVCVGNYDNPQVRGPGGAGLGISGDCFKRYYIYLTAHRKYNFVEKVDFISGVGHLNGFNTRLEAGLPEGGPCLVVTPLGVMDFESESKRMRLKSLNPGVTLEQVMENTGFELIIPANIPETKPPTDEELRILRNEIDPEGTLDKLMGRRSA